jgi:excinuclease ABC subunit B
MYGDTMTRSMRAAIDETYRRRALQVAHNDQHQITTRGIVKEIRDLTERVRQVAEEEASYRTDGGGTKAGVIAELPKDELARMVKDLESQMKTAAKDLEFEKAALIRDQIVELRRIIEFDPILN